MLYPSSAVVIREWTGLPFSGPWACPRRETQFVTFRFSFNHLITGYLVLD